MLVGMIALAIIMMTGSSSRMDTTLAGGCASEGSLFGKPKVSTKDSRLSYCSNGDADTGLIESGAFPAGTESLILALAGYPANRGLSLEAVSSDERHRQLIATPNIGDKWSVIRLTIPEPIGKGPFKLVLTDNAVGTHGWAGMSTPAHLTASATLKSYARLVFLPFMASIWLLCICISLPRCITSHASRPIAALLLLGLGSYFTFYMYVANKNLGKIVAITLLIAPFLSAFVMARRTKGLMHDAMRSMSLLAPSLFLAMFILWIGLYPFTWDGTQWDIPMNRWRNMPPDNFIPLLFADMLKRGSIVSPMLGDWLSSDRPPLQTGIFLMLAPVQPGGTGTLAYQAISTWAQTLIIIPIGVLLKHRSLRKIRSSMLVCVSFSSLVILNGLFVWPKLLAATYCLIYFIHLFRDASHKSSWVICAVAAAMALLSHGGSLFILIGITLAYLASGHLNISKLIKTSLLCIVAYIPWIAYQKLIDPPGDRLIKYHLAGVIPVTPDSLASTLHQAYANLTFSSWMTGRIANLHVHVSGLLKFFPESFQAFASASRPSVQTVIENSFFFPSYSSWFASPLIALMAIPILLITRKKSALPRLAGPMLTSTVLTALCFSLMMFVPGSTIIHHGSYLYPVFTMLIALGSAGIVNARFALVITALNLALAYLCYVLPGHLSDPVYLGGAVLLTLTLIHSLRAHSHPARRHHSSGSCHPATLPPAPSPDAPGEAPDAGTALPREYTTDQIGVTSRLKRRLRSLLQ